jgi:hypothetical protein
MRMTRRIGSITSTERGTSTRRWVMKSIIDTAAADTATATEICFKSVRLAKRHIPR